MNIKEVTLSLGPTDDHRTSVTRYQIGLLVLGFLVLLTITALVLSSAPSSQTLLNSAEEIDTDTARWMALGERYREEWLNNDRVAAANVARWNAMGERYNSGELQVGHTIDVEAARWIAKGERYQAEKLEAERIEAANIARWDSLATRYQAIGQ